MPTETPATQNKPKVKILNRDDVAAIIVKMPVEGVKLQDWIKRQGGELVDAIEQTIRQGIRQGNTLSQLAD